MHIVKPTTRFRPFTILHRSQTFGFHVLAVVAPMHQARVIFVTVIRTVALAPNFALGEGSAWFILVAVAVFLVASA